VEKISDILSETRTPPDRLGIEITETMAMSNIERTGARLKELAGIGINISVDDFGTGYSSLNYLKRFPIGSLKIDKSFVQDIATDPDDRAIINAVTAMAHNMKLKVIAEGVESDDQLSFLNVSGCDAVQGNLFSPALPPDEFIELARSGS
jgi:EAL domain-containing protein (putative c-di-GMP-specific phosphodiesterase class I)